MAIERQDIDALDEIYVRKDDCSAVQKDFEVKLTKSSGELALISKELVWIKWLLFASVGERLLSFISGKLPQFFS